jgi:cytochrome c553
MLKPLLILSTLLLFGLSAFPQQDQAPAKPESPATESIPVDATRKTNPVKPTAESIARGKKLYGYDCAMCHGKDGYGKGDVAEDMKLKIADFSNPEALRENRRRPLLYHQKWQGPDAAGRRSGQPKRTLGSCQLHPFILG